MKISFKKRTSFKRTMNGLAIIYKVWSEKGDKVYIGQTKQTIKERFSRHKKCFKQYDKDNTKSRATTCSVLFQEYGVENCQINSLEMVPFVTDEIINEKEEYWINFHPTAVNIIRPTPFTEERAKESKRAYYEEHKDTEEYKARMKVNSAKYEETHREEINARRRVYAQANPDKIKEENRAQYEKLKQNSDKYQAKVARLLEVIECECGTKTQRGNLSRHKKGTVHIEFMKK